MMILAELALMFVSVLVDCATAAPPQKKKQILTSDYNSILQSDFGHPNLFCSPCHVDAGYPGSGNMAFSS